MAAANALAAKGKKKEWEPMKYAADALTYSEGGDKQQAANWYEEVLTKTKSADIEIAAGDAYYQLSGGGTKANEHYTKALSLDPNSSIAYVRLGTLMYAAQNGQVALENWEKAKEKDPNNPLVYLELANAYFRNGKYEASKENLEKFLSLSDNTVKDQIRYAEAMYLTKDYPGTIAKVNELLAKGAQQKNLYGLLAYSYMEQKDSVSAAKALENVRIYFAKQDPKRIDYKDYMKYGRIAASNDLSDTADVYFAKSLQMDTAVDKSGTYRQIADGYKDARNWIAAAKWYKKLINEYPASVTANDYFWGGVSFYYGLDYPSAEAIFKEMTEKFADQPSGFYWMGRVNAAMDSEGEKGLALSHYEKWLTIEKEGYERKPADLMQAYQYMALYYYKKEDKANSMKYVEEILKIDAQNKLATDIKKYYAGKS